MNDQPKLRGSVVVTCNPCLWLSKGPQRDLRSFPTKAKAGDLQGRCQALMHGLTELIYELIWCTRYIATVIHKRMRIRASSPILLASSSTLRSVHVIPSVARYHLDTDTMCECSASWVGSLDHPLDLVVRFDPPCLNVKHLHRRAEMTFRH